MTEFNNDLVPDLLRKEHADHDRAMKALSSCSSPSACSPSRLTEENAPAVLRRLGYKSRWGLWYHREVDKRPTLMRGLRLWRKRRRDFKMANAESEVSE